MAIVNTSPKGQLVIPREMRKALGLNPGQPVILKLVGDHVELRPATADLIEDFCGAAAGGESLAEALLEERQAEVQRGR